jgi:hypothetical protein
MSSKHFNVILKSHLFLDLIRYAGEEIILRLHDFTKVANNAKVLSAHVSVGPHGAYSKWRGISIKHCTSSTHYKSTWKGKFPAVV